MRVSIVGDMPSRHALMKKCAEYVIESHKMVTPDTTGINVTVNVVGDMKGSGSLSVDPTQCLGDAAILPSTFGIDLKRAPLMKVLTTLCHEMVHVHQFRNREAYYLACGSLTYLGIVIDPADYNNEMEWLAFGREKFLVQQFCLDKGLTSQPWYVCPFV